MKKSVFEQHPRPGIFVFGRSTVEQGSKSQESVRQEVNAYPRVRCHWLEVAIMVLPSRLLTLNSHSYILDQNAHERLQFRSEIFLIPLQRQYGESKDFNEAKRRSKGEISGCEEGEACSCQGIACHSPIWLPGKWKDYTIAGENLEKVSQEQLLTFVPAHTSQRAWSADSRDRERYWSVS